MPQPKGKPYATYPEAHNAIMRFFDDNDPTMWPIFIGILQRAVTLKRSKSKKERDEVRKQARMDLPGLNRYYQSKRGWTQRHLAKLRATAEATRYQNAEAARQLEKRREEQRQEERRIWQVVKPTVNPRTAHDYITRQLPQAIGAGITDTTLETLLGYPVADLLKSLNVNPYTHGAEWTLSFKVPPDAFTLTRLSELRLCWSPQNLVAVARGQTPQQATIQAVAELFRKTDA